VGNPAEEAYRLLTQRHYTRNPHKKQAHFHESEISQRQETALRTRARRLEVLHPISPPQCKRYALNMDTQTILIILVVVLLLGGGGFFYGRRGR
jgi:LPXTG-motif cell wall-anchored protein